MSVCECSCDYGEDGLSCERGPHICRTPDVCVWCGNLVEYGQECLDILWFWFHDRGGHHKAHRGCHRLRADFADLIGCDCYEYKPFDFDAASQTAVANAADPAWQDWLFEFESNWGTFFANEKPDGRENAQPGLM